jgi:predicted dehydrogenase
MPIRWGIIGVGDVTEVKSGPGFQKAEGSSLVAVMRRDRAKAEDYARRHDVPVVHDTAETLIADDDVDAVYVATPPSSHRALALLCAAARKPCLVEKPMALTHRECLDMIDAFDRTKTPLWVAYYRRAQPRFLTIRRLVSDGRIGAITSGHVEILNRLATAEAVNDWHYQPGISGGGLIFDVGSHAVDLLDFFLGAIKDVRASAVNTGHSYPAEDVVTASFAFASGIAGSGVFNFNAFEKLDRLILRGTAGEISTPIYGDEAVIVRTTKGTDELPFTRPAHVHQPLIQTIVDELRGRGACESTAASGARASWVLDECVRGFHSVR